MLSFGGSTSGGAAAAINLLSERASSRAASRQVGSRADTGKVRRSTPPPIVGAAAAPDHHKIGQTHYEAKRFKEAIDAFVQALRVKPDDPRVHYDLGMAYYGLNRFKEAAETFERAVRFKPDWDEARYRLGLVYYVLGKRASSIEQHRILQQLNPQLAGVLARVLKVEGSTAAATAAAKTAGVDNTQPVLLTAGMSNNADTVVVVMRPAPSLDVQTPTPGAAAPATANDPSKNGAASAADATAKDDAGESSLTETYRLGVGDVLDIRLLNSKTNASSLYTVLASGVLDHPLAAGFVVSGMTTDELEARLTSEVKRRAISDNPQVSVSVRDYASHTVTLKGLVRNTGARALRREAVPLYVVLAEAQPNPEAGRATILRGGQSTSIELADQAAMNTLVRPGDVIDVLARAPKFYFIGGQVQQPGQKVFQPGLTLMQAILTAGGVSRPGSSNVIELSRESAGGRLTTTKFALKDIKSGKVPDPRLESGDLIEVVQ